MLNNCGDAWPPYNLPGARPPGAILQSRGSPSAEACVTRQRDTDPKTLVHLLVLVLYLGCDAETATVGQIWSAWIV